MYLSFPHYFCDQTELGSASPKWSKARLLTLHVVKQSRALTAGLQALRMGQLVLETPKPPMAFREGFLKTE